MTFEDVAKACLDNHRARERVQPADRLSTRSQPERDRTSRGYCNGPQSRFGSHARFRGFHQRLRLEQIRKSRVWIMKVKTECKRGHPWNEATTRLWIDSTGREQRACRKCHALACRASYVRRKARRRAARAVAYPPMHHERATRAQTEFNRYMRASHDTDGSRRTVQGE